MRLGIIYTLLLLMCLTGCNEWLDVKPQTSIQEDDLFKSERGFKDVLTGFYIQMGNSNLYGQALTMTTMERLAKRYNWPLVQDKEAFNFEANKGTYNQIYKDMYQIIANINNMIHNLEIRKNVIKTKHYYEIMKAEALGLRGFLHFDLLRMWGPIHTLDPMSKSICYRTKLDKYATPRLAADAVLDSIIVDLTAAEKLLTEHDPCLYIANDKDKDQDMFLRLRQQRMNLHAVKATLARVHCWRGSAESKKLACKYAQEVIDSKHFSLLQSVSISPILYAEHIFCLNVVQLNTMTDGLFERKEGIQNLSLTTMNYGQIFNNAKDIRSKNFRIGSGDVYITTKYNQKDYVGDYTGKDIIPLIRIPEMYLIIAECHDDPIESIKAINIVQQARKSLKPYSNSTWDQLAVGSVLAPDATKSNRINEIMKEYMYEFFAEGQLYYFYKRHNYKKIYPDETEMELSRYRFLLPTNEEIFGDNN